MALAKSLVLAANQKAPPATGTFSRRNRFVERIQQQIDLALKFERGERPSRSDRRSRRWWWQEGQSFFLAVQYARQPLELAKGKWSIQCTDLNGVVEALVSVQKAASAGEFDALLETQAKRVMENFSRSKQN